MCGNPGRKFHGKDTLTMQERKAALMSKDDFKSLMASPDSSHAM